jgi:hypothetical protein
MERLLNSVGKMCFVEYFNKFANTNIDHSDLVNTIHEEKGYSLKACQTRVSKARKIIGSGHTCDALQTIINAQRVDEKTRSSATQLYEENCNQPNT